MKNKIPYEEIENGAQILLLLRESNTWEKLCNQYAYVNPDDLNNTTTLTLRNKLLSMRELGLINFKDEETPLGKKPVGEIDETGLWSKIRVVFGGMSLSDAVKISRHSGGMAIVPSFGRPNKPDEKVDVFVLMPFKTELEKVYTNHIKKLGGELNLNIRRGDEIFVARPFMEKVWNGICAAELILADCTEQNPNVFYEIGMAHTVGKKVVLITRSEKDIPSDIRHFDYILYRYDPEGVELLIKKLKEFLTSHFSL